MTIVKLKKHQTSTAMNAEIKSSKRAELAEKISATLASTYVLYHKTQGVHWNVTGPLFVSVHNLTEGHYQDLAQAIDDLAERVRALGAKVPVGLTSYVEGSALKDTHMDGDVNDMITELADDHSRIADEMRSVVADADEAHDVYTADLLTARIGVHEEAAWMLNALAEK